MPDRTADPDMKFNDPKIVLIVAYESADGNDADNLTPIRGVMEKADIRGWLEAYRREGFPVKISTTDAGELFVQVWPR